MMPRACPVQKNFLAEAKPPTSGLMQRGPGPDLMHCVLGILVVASP